MIQALLSIVAASAMIFMMVDFKTESNVNPEPLPEIVKTSFTLTGAVQPRETLEVIFNK